MPSQESSAALLASGSPFIGCWNPEPPQLLTEETIQTFRTRFASLTEQRHHDFVYAGGAVYGVSSNGTPAQALALDLFHQLQSPFGIYNDAAVESLFEPLLTPSYTRALTELAWNSGVFFPDGMILADAHAPALLAHVVVLLEVLAKFSGLPIVGEKARKLSLLLQPLQWELHAGISDEPINIDLRKSFLEANEEVARELFPDIYETEKALERLVGTQKENHLKLERLGIKLPPLSSLLLSELSAKDLAPDQALRRYLGDLEFIELRSQFIDDSLKTVNATELEVEIARAISSRLADSVFSWVISTRHALFRLLEISNADNSFPNLPDLQTTMTDLCALHKRPTVIAKDAVLQDFTSEAVPIGSTRINPEDRTAMEELQSLVGLDEAKKAIEKVLRGTELAEARYQAGVRLNAPAKHLVFLGNPGTGKTRVSRLLAKVYKERGVLRKGHLVEAKRADLIGEGIGTTAPKVRRKVNEALGGVLFIDEAYMLAGGDSHQDFGPEAVDELMTLMDDHKDDLVVIAAGYRDQMADLFRINPGLESRFGAKIPFNNYSDDELVQIFEDLVQDANLRMTPEVSSELRLLLPRKRPPRFGNARTIHRLFEATVERQGLRLSDGLEQRTAEELQELTVADLREDQSDDKARAQILKDALADLDELVGLDEVKHKTKTLINEVRLAKIMRNAGVKPSDTANHLLFMGNPGSGKTEVARILARVFHGLGVVSQGHLVEAHRSDMIAGYIGQTALKTEALLESALGGVLFIDEAYDLASDGNQDFTNEAISKLLTYMEDYRDDLVVIAAGYGPDMDHFLKANPGLASRFPVTLDFPDYSPQELLQVLLRMAQSESRIISGDAAQALPRIFEEKAFGNSDFGNARFARSLFATAKSNQANRLAQLPEPENSDPETLKTLLAEDFELRR